MPATGQTGMLLSFTLQLYALPRAKPVAVVTTNKMKENENAAILVVDDVEEVRDGIQSLLEADGYWVDSARSDKDAVECALRKPPQLILLNLAGSPEQVTALA